MRRIAANSGAILTEKLAFFGQDDEEEEFTHWRFGGDEAARQDGGAIDHSRVRALFDEFDDDSNGYLDAEEVRAFSATLGLALSA